MKPTIKLNKEAQKIFDLVLEHLKEFGVIESIDSQVVSQYSASTALYNYYMNKAMGDPDFLVTEYKNGSNVNGNYNAMQGFGKTSDTYAKQLGLSPESREKIKAFNEKPVKVKNGFTDFKQVYKKAD